LGQQSSICLVHYFKTKSYVMNILKFDRKSTFRFVMILLLRVMSMYH